MGRGQSQDQGIYLEDLIDEMERREKLSQEPITLEDDQWDD